MYGSAEIHNKSLSLDLDGTDTESIQFYNCKFVHKAAFGCLKIKFVQVSFRKSTSTVKVWHQEHDEYMIKVRK